MHADGHSSGQPCDAACTLMGIKFTQKPLGPSSGGSHVDSEGWATQHQRHRPCVREGLPCRSFDSPCPRMISSSMGLSPGNHLLYRTLGLAIECR